MYAGSFNPPTIAHVAIAHVALKQCRLDSVTFAVSERALAKEAADAGNRPRMIDRIAVLRQLVDENPGFELLITPKQLIVEIAEGFDVVVMGADKWTQIQDPVFYGNDPARRDQAMNDLPDVALIPRPPLSTGDASTLKLSADVAALIDRVSSSRARSGEHELMVEAAKAFDARTGAWTDPQRYERWIAEQSE